MTNYADALRTNTATFEDAATLIEGTLVPYSQVFLAGSLSTSSTTAVDMTSMSITLTINSGEIVEIMGWMAFSHSTLNYNCHLVIAEDGVALGENQNINFRTSTAGIDQTIVMTYLKAPSAGSHTYKLQWYTFGATMYSSKQFLSVKVFQNTY